MASATPTSIPPPPPPFIEQYVGQSLYRAHAAKLSKRAQEVTGMPLINYNFVGNNPLSMTTVNGNVSDPNPKKERLKRTFSATTHYEIWAQQHQQHWRYQLPPQQPPPHLETMQEFPETGSGCQLSVFPANGKPLLCETMSMPLLGQNPFVTGKAVSNMSMTTDNVVIHSRIRRKLGDWQGRCRTSSATRSTQGWGGCVLSETAVEKDLLLGSGLHQEQHQRQQRCQDQLRGERGRRRHAQDGGKDFRFRFQDCRPEPANPPSRTGYQKLEHWHVVVTKILDISWLLQYFHSIF